MSENKIQYTNRNYDDYRKSLIELSRKYYSDVFDSFGDASIGQWLIDVLSDIGDNLNYHIDRSYQETNIDSAQQISSLQDMARTNGLRISGKKSALCEIEISCVLPVYQQGNNGNGNIAQADENYCPYIKRGTLFSNGSTTFELMNDIDFASQFNSDGYSDREIIPNRNSNGVITGYTYKKLAVVSAGQSKIYKKVITSSDIKPFMEVLLQDNDILGVESIIFKEGSNLNSDPTIAEFYVDEETYYDKLNKPVQRYFEVDNLLEQERYGYEIQKTDLTAPLTDGEKTNRTYYNPIWDKEGFIIGDENIDVREVVRGKWKPLKNKFITEYQDNWYLKIIFGSGIRNNYGEIPSDAKSFTQYMMSRMEANDYMGVLPETNTTMYVLYRVGGGEMSNIAAGTLNSIIYLNMDIVGNCDDNDNARKIKNVRSSLSVTNTTPSYGGKDEPSSAEIRHMIKYNSAEQNRCVTLNDYKSRIQKIPAKYGLPFRFSVNEENNKVVIYTLGLDYNGKLTRLLAETVANNIKTYLSHYKMLNDFIEIKSGKIINIAFRLTMYVDKSYSKSEVTKRVIDMVYDYMDIRNHQMGEDIFLGDLSKEIGKLDGVQNLVSIKCYNKVGNGGDGYSSDTINQPLVNISDCCNDEYAESDINFDNQIDLDSSDYTLIGDSMSMFEIRDKNHDIEIIVKTR